MTNKFKFGDKVWHEEYGNGVYGKSSDLKVTTLSQVMFESVGCINVLTSELTLTTDWVKCSERMPETYTKVLVLVEVGNDSKQHIFVDELYESTKYGMLWQNNDNLVTHWMPLPAPPLEVER